MWGALMDIWEIKGHLNWNSLEKVHLLNLAAGIKESYWSDLFCRFLFSFFFFLFFGGGGGLNILEDPF